MKINLIGTSGSGKSTLARRIAAELAIPYIEMDQLYWRPNWQGTEDDALWTKLENTLTATENWVLDGNYNRTRPVKWRNVDLVVWVDYGFTRTLYQAVSRAFRRAWHKQELWPGTGNCESFRRSFFSRKSIIIWTIKTWRSNRERYEADMRNPQYDHIRFVRITRRQDAETLISSLKAQSEKGFAFPVSGNPNVN
ncbi:MULTISPECIES: AAA family ATPase [Enterobacter]|uniref:AAA family ATPase n=1 Tax=Enterobacter TaxID=547 RepID=UPI0015EA031A|nr:MULTISPECIES: AAA family ATPase [Enterobacter]HDR2787879.1 adenylate kinase [Enterobacter asburiae]QMR78483.1 adenylate kinase [Enterobacter sp. RHBSTW-00175]WNT34539.1 adenylate kinase [Enterobacter cloacae]HDR2793587.1 adenylate kinase [Enterobacter asburiae]HDR2798894.1 adenylate kinase [Enterobacter asburiae]